MKSEKLYRLFIWGSLLVAFLLFVCCVVLKFLGH